jgi:hypothetical protein
VVIAVISFVIGAILDVLDYFEAPEDRAAGRRTERRRLTALGEPGSAPVQYLSHSCEFAGRRAGLDRVAGTRLVCRRPLSTRETPRSRGRGKGGDRTPAAGTFGFTRIASK